jgi:LAO/AO transport system kinase
MAPLLTVGQYADGVRAGDRGILARAITLIESRAPRHQQLAQELLVFLLPESGKSVRVGISGVPGVGKSTFIDAMGMQLIEQGHKIAVLAVDPSSTVTAGSILGDKTRMARLSVEDRAFIRPSPTSGNLGGVARATRESMVLVEAAGYDVVLVETVGVGQSEITVANMVDTFLFLTLARTGDQLQGIKKGVLELADVIAVNKADGDFALAAKGAARELASALRLMRGHDDIWNAPVLTCAGLTGDGLDGVWRQVIQHRLTLEKAGHLATKRATQQVEWTWSMVTNQLLSALHNAPRVRELTPIVEAKVRSGELTATLAAEQILAAFRE